MAAAGLSVTVTHSEEKHDLQVTPQEGNTESTVQDLAQVVEEATGIPLPFQKLIFKGKSLKENGDAVVSTWNTKWLPAYVNWEKEQSGGRS